jgi:hypothetical protein
MPTTLNAPENEIIGANRSYDVGMNSQLDSGQIRWQLEGEDIILRFTADLLRRNIDNKGNIIPIIVGNDSDGNQMMLMPLMNEVGIRDFRSILSPYLTKNMWLSEFDKFEIADMVKDTMVTVLGTLYLNYKEYQIEEHNLDIIVDLTFKYIYSAAKRAEGGAEKKFLSTINKSIEHKLTKIEDPSNQSKGGMFSFLKRN